MVAPLLALAGSLGGVYSVGRMYDNLRYWNAYRRNTGFSPRYPFRSGSMDWMRYGMSAGMSFYPYAQYRNSIYSHYPSNNYHSYYA